MANSDKNDDFIKSLFLRYHPDLIRYATIQMGNPTDAEDVVAELWKLAVLKQDILRSHPNKIGWLYTTLNMCQKQHNYKDSIRTTQDGKSTYSKIKMVPLDTALESMTYEEKQGEGDPFQKLDGILNATEKELLELKYNQNLTNEEIAQKSGRSYWSVLCLSRLNGFFPDLVESYGMFVKLKKVLSKTG